ncbi:MAG: VWA domain-containing protein [Pseudomonadota bacterium]
MPEWLLVTWPGTVEFRDPGLLWTLLLAPLCWWFANRRFGALIYSSTAIAATAPRSLRVKLAWLPGAALTAAVVCLAVALAGPRTGDATQRIKREGIAIMLVIDRSGSMDARDFVTEDRNVNRLDAVKQVLSEFVLGGEIAAGRPDDLIGAVAFGTFADSVSPLTLDHANLMSIVSNLRVASTPQEGNTAIGEGLGLAVERLRTYPTKAKVIVLLTDGENTAGTLTPLQAADLASQHGIKVYTVGAGTTGYAPMPVTLGDGRVRLMRRQVRIDERTLKAIADRAGGRYFKATDLDELGAVYAQIDALERSEIAEVRYRQYREHYVWFVVLALSLTIAAELLGATLLRRLP